ncbi:polysaccharide deacetylase family protein [Flavobacteriaceae bacterium]|nr:polysaccharide deacetylase family protein [Flavobacteriaceae bacterium]
MKAIMYHYVRYKDKKFPHLFRLDFDLFKKQLDYFEKKYGFISKEAFINSIRNKEEEKGIILTFDDGLYCHYKNVFPELKKRGLWGIFYIPTFPFKENQILDVHRIHILISNCNAKDLYAYLQKIQIQKLFDKNKIDEYKRLTYINQDNDQYSLIIKRILNYFIRYDKRKSIIDQLFNKFIKENFTIEDFYLSINNLKEMNAAGMIIGSHTENHLVMSKLSDSLQKYEIENSFNYIESKIGSLEIKTFCYPYGGFHTFNDKTQEILSNNGCEFSFNVEQRDITSNDLKHKVHALPRFDCNQFKYGSASNI